MNQLIDNDFENVVKTTPLLVIDFYADWCNPCKMIALKLKELSEEYTDVKFMKCNVDENPNISLKYNIRALPTVLLIKRGEVVNLQTGSFPKIVYEEAIKEFLLKA